MQITSPTQSSPSSSIQVPKNNTAITNNHFETPTNSTSSVADTLSITSSKSMVVMKVITQNVELALEIKNPVMHINKDEDDSDSRHHIDNQAKKLTDKIIQKFHHEKESNSKDMPEKIRHSDAANSIRSQVARGFENATLALSKLGMFDDSVKNDVEQTRSQIDSSIDRITDTHLEGSDEAPASTVAAVTSNMVSVARAVSTALQIITKDGDTVTLNLSRSQAMTAGNSVGPEDSLTYAGYVSNTQIEISIDGDINKKEKESIEKIVKRLNKLADKMFNGDSGNAMEKLSKLKINTETLASMSLSMSSSISYQAVSTYSETSRVTDNIALPINDSPQLPKKVDTELDNNLVNNQTDAITTTKPAGQVAAQVIQETANTVNTTVEEDTLDNPFQSIRNLFTQIADMLHSQQPDITDSHKTFVSELFNNIIDNLHDEHEETEH